MGRGHTSVLLLPFIGIWKLIELVIKLTSRLTAAIIGFVLMVVGIILCITVVGIVVGVPLIILGFTMMIRGFF